MAKLLVTGATGFIGSHLVPLLQRDHEVQCLASNLLHYDAVTQEVLAYEPDRVIHLAARTEVERSFYEQITFSEINYLGTVNLVEAMLACKTRPGLIFASTMEVYGWQPVSDDIKNGQMPSPIPVFDPDHTDTNPNAPYAVAKLACEKYIQYANRAHGLPYVNLRQTNAYGRKDNDFFVTEQIISQMLRDPRQCNLGYNRPFRNFIYVEDLIDAWITVIDRFDTIANNTFTLGPDNALAIETHAENIARKIGWQGQINWNTKPYRPGEIYLLNSSEDKLKCHTGWSPKVSYDQGLDRTIEIWQRQLAAD